MGKSKIEWTERSWNPIRDRLSVARDPNAKFKFGTYCTKVSPGCNNCYAGRSNNRFYGRDFEYQKRPYEPFIDREILAHPSMVKRPSMFFVCSQTDLFHEAVDYVMIRSIWRTMTENPQHIFQVLTKRPERMYQELKDWYGHYEWRHIPNNIWIGVTCENQEMADKRIPILLQTPAAVRWLSIEPMLGPVNLRKWIDKCPASRHVDGPLHGWVFDGDDPYVVCTWCGERRDARSGRIIGTRMTARPGIDWIVCGGESGRGARPMHPDWVRSLRDQCLAANVPFFFKQWGSLVTEEQSPEDIVLPGTSYGLLNNCDTQFYRVKKHEAGRLLDGVEWSQYPEVNK